MAVGMFIADRPTNLILDQPETAFYERGRNLPDNQRVKASLCFCARCDECCYDGRLFFPRAGGRSNCHAFFTRCTLTKWHYCSLKEASKQSRFLCFGAWLRKTYFQ